MKLVTFEVTTPIGPVQRIGAINRDKIIDLNMGHTRYLADKDSNGRPYELAAAVLPPDMIAFFRSGKEGREAARTTIDYIVKQQSKAPIMGPHGEKIVYDMAEVKLKAPVPGQTPSVIIWPSKAMPVGPG
jgi:hypothetical protein